jgi:hypothetical protein
MWLALAAAALPPGHSAAKYRDIAASKMTPSQIEEAQRLVRAWTPKPKTVWDIKLPASARCRQ